VKKALLALAAVAAFTAPALAADMAAKAPIAAPIPYATPWTGFWVSGGFGYGLADIEHSVRSPVAPFAAFDTGHDNGARGWLGKVGIGYDFQMSSWVIGAFADATFSDIAGTSNFNCPGACIGPTGFSGRFKNDWSWAVGGRIGYVALPGLLTYVNGGWTEANFTGTNFLDASTGLATGLSLPSQRRDGWFLGGGTEYAFNFLPGLFLKSEYRFADFDNHDSNLICDGTVVRGCGAAGAIASIDRSRVFVQTITTELVYRFNWSGVGAGGAGRY
jgi:outer membrane immunogenic protein